MSSNHKSVFMPIKQKHHYVWGHYLSRWEVADKESYIWFSTVKNTVVCDSISGRCCQQNFYKIRTLDRIHFEIIKSFFGDSDDNVIKQADDFFQKNRKLKIVESITSNNEEKEKEKEKCINIIKSNMFEELHTNIENFSKEILTSLANGKLEVLDNKENMINFLNFLGHQEMRTESIKHRFVETIKKRNIVLAKKVEECWFLASFLFGIRRANSLIYGRASDRHTLLINETEEPFITSDQPVINAHPSLKLESTQQLADDEYDIYYPISPIYGYMIHRSKRFEEGKVMVSIDVVKELNKKIAENSNKLIIGNQEGIVKKYKKYVGTKIKLIKTV